MTRGLLLKLYLGLSGGIFALVAVFHGCRIARHWLILVGPAEIPHALSWIGLPASTLYAICAFLLLRWELRRQAS